ncbi:unnamed protein product [Closterium sp. Naga37s-1]|nr:unnamed protein product [Closterium sp. Naga37s-1]
MLVQDPTSSEFHVLSPQATVAAHTATPCRPPQAPLAIADSAKAASGGAESGGGGGARDSKFLRVSIQSVALALAFGGAAAFLRMLLSALPPDFLSRWKKLFAEQPHFDPKTAVEARRATAIYDCHGDLIATVVPGGFGGRRKDASKGQAPLKPTEVPAVMWQAVIATEDRRFFEHQGFDPKGLTRAIMSLARTGGGSTITQQVRGGVRGGRRGGRTALASHPPCRISPSSQLVKNVFLSNERRWTRKLVEIILAVIIERRMTKWDILHLYLNKIYWGHGVTGLEAASALYFGKHPSLLTLGECAMLAGIIPAPELLSPYRDPSRGRKPQARALRRMVEAGFLDIATATEAMQQPLRLGSEAKHGTSGPWRAPFFVSEVLYELAQRYGREEVVRGGLQVHTTLDLTMQDAGEKVVGDGTREYDQEREAAAQRDIAAIAMKLEELRGRRQQQILATVAAAAVKRSAEFRKKNGQTQKTVSEMMADETAAVARTLKRFAAMERTLTAAMQRYENELRSAQAARLEGAMVAMDPLSGEVRVLVGGRDYYESCFNRATQALRPPGSTFKPVVYLTALAEGIWPPGSTFKPVVYLTALAEGMGPVTLEESLLKSLNVPTVKLCAEIGVDKVCHKGGALGINTPLPHELALSLGGCEVCHMGRALGIKTPLPHELALSLGGCEVTPLQLTTVYCTIAAGGIYHRPHLITRVESYNGRVLEEAKVCMERKDPVVDEAAVGELRKLLQAVVERGTGKGARMDRPCAGKTGTSDGHRDCWFAGFTPQLACVVWLGYDDNKPVSCLHPGTGSPPAHSCPAPPCHCLTTLHPSPLLLPSPPCQVWLGYDDNLPVGGLHPGTGSSHAAPLWSRFMTLAHEGLPVKKILDPARDRYSGRAAGREFQKRSRRAQKVGLSEVRRREGVRRKGRREVVWKDVWDWEKASSGWQEREKMEEWATARRERAEEIRALRAKWGWLPFVKGNKGAGGEGGGESPGRGLLGDEGEEVGEDDYEDALRFFERANQEEGQGGRRSAERGGERGGEREGGTGRVVSAAAMAAAKWGAGGRGGGVEKRSGSREMGAERRVEEEMGRRWSAEGVEGEEEEESEACARDEEGDDEDGLWEEGEAEEEEEEEAPEEVLARMQERLEEQFGVRLVEAVFERRGGEGGRGGVSKGRGEGPGGTAGVGVGGERTGGRREVVSVEAGGSGEVALYEAVAMPPVRASATPPSASLGGLTWSERVASAQKQQLQQQQEQIQQQLAADVTASDPSEPRAEPQLPYTEPQASRTKPQVPRSAAQTSVAENQAAPAAAAAAAEEQREVVSAKFFPAVDSESAALEISPLQPWPEKQGDGAEGGGEMEACCPMPPCTGLLPACREPSLEGSADAERGEVGERELEEEDEEKRLGWTKRLFVKTRVTAPGGAPLPLSSSGSYAYSAYTAATATATTGRGFSHEDPGQREVSSPPLVPSPSSLGPPSSLAPSFQPPAVAGRYDGDASSVPGSSAGMWGSAVPWRQQKGAGLGPDAPRNRAVGSPALFGRFGGTSRTGYR